MTFEELAGYRRFIGAIKYRQKPGDPFVGDPIAHAREEVLDLWNYTVEAEHQRKLGPARSIMLRTIAKLAWKLLE